MLSMRYRYLQATPYASHLSGGEQRKRLPTSGKAERKSSVVVVLVHLSRAIAIQPTGGSSCMSNLAAPLEFLLDPSEYRRPVVISFIASLHVLVLDIAFLPEI